MNPLKVFDEPKLEFANRQLLEHPRDGLTLFGPIDSSGIDKPKRIRFGLVGSSQGIALFNAFAARFRREIPTIEGKEEIWPSFPGFEEAFHAVWPETPAVEEQIDQAALVKAAELPDSHQRVFAVTELYLGAIKKAKRRDEVCDVFVCVVPEIVFKNCRPLSKVQGAGPKPRGKEMALRSQMEDMFGGYQSEQYDYSVDFRRQIKARVMEYDVPIQIIRDSTLQLTEPEKGQRLLTPISDRAWNLATTLYYKTGGKPWKLSGTRDGVCYVGVAFKKTEDNRSACCAAQMFLNDGDGVVFLGDEGRWFSEKTGECHLSREAARKLLTGILKTYSDQGGKPLKEIFLHCRSSLNTEEYLGYLDACPKDAKLVGIRVAPDRSGMRLYRLGTRPLLRGSFWQTSEKTGYLWGSGFKPRLRTYDGSEVPVPLAIAVEHGSAPIEQVAKDILGLTKLNYNASKLGEFQPVTIRFSEEVGEILVTNRKVGKRHPNFKYYI